MSNQHNYSSGHIKVYQQFSRRETHCVVDENFSSRKELWKLLFQFKGSPVELVVSFDEPADGYDLEATLGSAI